jgi:hypothetical protein
VALQAAKFHLPQSLNEDEWSSNSPSKRHASLNAPSESVAAPRRASAARKTAAGGVVGYTAYRVVTEEEQSQEADSQDNSNWF